MRAGNTLTMLCSKCQSHLVLAFRSISEAGRAGDSQLQHRQSRSLAASKLSLSAEGREGSGRDQARMPAQRRRTSEAINNDGLSDVSCLPFTAQAIALLLLLASGRGGSFPCRARHAGPSKMSYWHGEAVCGKLDIAVLVMRHIPRRTLAGHQQCRPQRLEVTVPLLLWWCRGLHLWA